MTLVLRGKFTIALVVCLIGCFVGEVWARRKLASRSVQKTAVITEEAVTGNATDKGPWSHVKGIEKQCCCQSDEAPWANGFSKPRGTDCIIYEKPVGGVHVMRTWECQAPLVEDGYTKGPQPQCWCDVEEEDELSDGDEYWPGGLQAICKALDAAKEQPEWKDGEYRDSFGSPDSQPYDCRAPVRPFPKGKDGTCPFGWEVKCSRSGALTFEFRTWRNWYGSNQQYFSRLTTSAKPIKRKDGTFSVNLGQTPDFKGYQKNQCKKEWIREKSVRYGDEKREVHPMPISLLAHNLDPRSTKNEFHTWIMPTEKSVFLYGAFTADGNDERLTRIGLATGGWQGDAYVNFIGEKQIEFFPKL